MNRLPTSAVPLPANPDAGSNAAARINRLATVDEVSDLRAAGRMVADAIATPEPAKFRVNDGVRLKPSGCPARVVEVGPGANQYTITIDGKDAHRVWGSSLEAFADALAEVPTDALRDNQAELRQAASEMTARRAGVTRERSPVLLLGPGGDFTQPVYAEDLIDGRCEPPAKPAPKVSRGQIESYLEKTRAPGTDAHGYERSLGREWGGR